MVCCTRFHRAVGVDHIEDKTLLHKNSSHHGFLVPFIPVVLSTFILHLISTHEGVLTCILLNPKALHRLKVIKAMICSIVV